jgi:hypothetical protein
MMRRTTQRLVAAGSFAAALVLAAKPAAAEPTAAPPATGQIERARAHYERGLRFFGEDSFEAALVEFEHAYELAPSYRILYNMARIQRQQNNYAAALRNLQVYLADGGAELSEERRREVEREIEALRGRVAAVDVEVNVGGADVLVDDAPACAGTPGPNCADHSPLATPLLVNPGRRKVTASKPGYQPASVSVRVAGAERARARLELQPIVRAGAPEAPTGARKTWAIVAWGAAGALAVGASATGLATLGAQGDLKDRRGEFADEPGVFDDRSKRLKNLALATDLLAGAALASGLAAAFLTFGVSDAGAPAGRERRAGVSVGAGPAGVAVFGRF